MNLPKTSQSHNAPKCSGHFVVRTSQAVKLIAKCRISNDIQQLHIVKQSRYKAIFKTWHCPKTQEALEAIFSIFNSSTQNLATMLLRHITMTFL